MAKVILKPNGSHEPIAVEVQRNGGQFAARIGDLSVEGRLESAPGGGHLLRIGNRSRPFFVNRKNGQVEVWIDGATYRFELLGAKSRKASAAAGMVSHEITAPMPGTVLRIHLKQGEAFTAHQPLIIMESMKMEMTLSAPHGGRVSQVLCVAGELAPMGKVLMKLEPEETHAQVPA